MSSQLRSTNGVLYNLSILTVGQVVAQLANMAALIFLADYLGAHWFGIIQVGVAFMSYALITAEWGMMSLGIREVSRLEAPPAIAAYVSQHMTLLAIQAAATVGVGLLLLPRLPFYGHAPLIFTLYLATVVVQVYTQNWVAVGLEKMTWVGVSRMVRSLVYAFFVLVVLSRIGGFGGRPAAYWIPVFFLVAMACANLTVNVPVARWFGRFLHPGRISRREAVRRWRETGSIGANILVLRVLYNIDILMLGVLASPDVAGNYAAASRIIFQLVVAVELLWAALLPRLSRLAKQSRTAFRAAFNLYFGYVLAVLLPIAVGGVLTGNGLIDFLYHGKFPAAGPVFRILAVAYSMLAAGMFLGNTLLACDRQRSYLLPLVAGSLTAITGVVWLVPGHMGLGAAWAMFTAHGLLLAILLVINARLFRRDLLGLLAGVVPALAAMILVISVLSGQHVLLRIGAGALVYALPVAWPLRRFRRRLLAAAGAPGNLEHPPGLA